MSAPILILLIAIPLLRPLRSPDPRLISDDEQARLATVQAIVEHGSQAIEGTEFRDTRDIIVSKADVSSPFPSHVYSKQPPMMALLLSGPYWLMHRAGLSFSRDSSTVIFWLTLIGVTIPVSIAGGLVYRMSKTFELKRPLRALLAVTVVLGSGLISYATTLNAHAPAATLLLAAASCLIHVIFHNVPRRAAPWLASAGFFAALAATIDPPAIAFLLPLILVVGAFRWPIGMRTAGLLAYALGAALPIVVHAQLVRPITGDLRPGMFHSELAVAPRVPQSMPWSGASLTSSVCAVSAPGHSAVGDTSALAGSNSPDDDDEPHTRWRAFLHGAWRILGSFLGKHGVFSHFPIVVLGILGVSLIMHRHWPAATKMLAGGTLGGALAVIVVYALCRSSTRDAMFATRWFVVFLPLTLFWAGAWLRRSHRRSSWIMAGALLAFSVTASLIGATGPLPRGGFSHYTVAGAWHNLMDHPQPPPALLSPVADRGGQEAFSE
ncbi:MAG TPA: hypothetical protein VG326_20260 [Tepidisphaeraceae bacterium]|nr:hypothetical protein [Tepidisphaeraceae bacterium]